MLRKASLGDLEVLESFQDLLVSYERSFDAGIPHEGRVVYYDIKKLLPSDNVHFLVAEINGEIVGCGFGEIRKNDMPYINEYYGYIGLMIVKEKHRGTGIGKSIAAALVSWFKEKEIFDIRLKVYAKNDEAIEAYKKYGFTEFVLEMKYEG